MYTFASARFNIEKCSLNIAVVILIIFDVYMQGGPK